MLTIAPYAMEMFKLTEQKQFRNRKQKFYYRADDLWCVHDSSALFYANIYALLQLCAAGCWRYWQGRFWELLIEQGKLYRKRVSILCSSINSNHDSVYQPKGSQFQYYNSSINSHLLNTIGMKKFRFQYYYSSINSAAAYRHEQSYGSFNTTQFD